jgi:hypothetical protein
MSRIYQPIYKIGKFKISHSSISIFWKTKFSFALEFALLEAFITS